MPSSVAMARSKADTDDGQHHYIHDGSIYIFKLCNPWRSTSSPRRKHICILPYQRIYFSLELKIVAAQCFIFRLPSRRS
eukprot:scaffold9476_cov77-Skeletonema_dohrnii-CCMP3373.AAC.1